MRHLAFPLALSLALGCSSEEPPNATLMLTAGQEADAFTRTPVPERLVLDAVSLSGASEQMLDMAWPSGGFDIGDYDPDQVLAFEAFGRDATGRTILRGATIYHALWTLNGAEVPVFMGRVGELSRPAGTMPLSRIHGVAAIIDARFIVTMGGTEVREADGTEAPAATFSAYDLGAWQASAAREELPRSPTSLAVVMGRYALAIDDAGASWFDFATYDSAQAEAPAGVAFSELSGGEVVHGDQGESYVVGPTRLTQPSAAILRVGSEGALSAIRLDAPRLGAAAAHVTGRGLVLVGGHATEPGVVLLQADATTFAPLPFPADPVEGAGAAVLDEERLLLAGGSHETAPATTRLVDLSCTGSCVATELGEELEPVGIPDAWARCSGPDEVVVVGSGDDAQGATRFVRLVGLNATPSIQEAALREPRIGATPIALFGRTVGLVGGRRLDGSGVRTLEIYVPE